MKTGYRGGKDRADKLCESVKGMKMSDDRSTPILPYAYTCDHFVVRLLETGIAQRLLHSIVKRFVEPAFDEVRTKCSPITATSHPRLYAVVADCCFKLGIVQLPEVVVSSRLTQINALSAVIDQRSLILVSPRVVCLDEGELRFLIGHELAHTLDNNGCHLVGGILWRLKQKHPVVGEMVNNAMAVALNEWCRCSELTADRAGLQCCGSMQYVYSLMAKIGYSSQNTIRAIDQYAELYCDHPLVSNRVQQLELYIQNRDKNDRF